MCFRLAAPHGEGRFKQLQLQIACQFYALLACCVLLTFHATNVCFETDDVQSILSVNQVDDGSAKNACSLRKLV